MSTTPGPGPVMMEFKCSQCPDGKIVAQQPMLRFFNMPDLSGMIYVHNRVATCPQCGTAFVCLLNGLDPESRVLFMWTPVQTQQSAIAAPTDANMKSALAAQELASKVKLN